MWIVYSLLGVFFISLLIILLKYMQHIQASACMLFVMFVACIFFFLQSIYNKSLITLFSNKHDFFILIICGLLSYVGNLFWLKGFLSAPNPAYSLAIFDIRTIIVGIGCYFLFSSELSALNGIGIIITFIGLRMATI